MTAVATSKEPGSGTYPRVRPGTSSSETKTPLPMEVVVPFDDTPADVLRAAAIDPMRRISEAADVARLKNGLTLSRIRAWLESRSRL